MKLIRELIATVIDVAVIYAIWLGNNGYPGIGNIVAVFYWVIIVVIGPLAIIGISIEDTAKLHKLKSSKARRFAAAVIDICSIGLFAYYGQFVMSGVAIIAMLQMLLVWGIVGYRIEKAKELK